MQMSNKLHPAYIIRLYTLELLKQSLGMQPINGFEPIVAVNDEPALEGSGKTYLVYGFADFANNKSYEIRKGSIAYRVVSPSVAELGEVTTTISRALEMGDISARYVNGWSSKYQGGVLNGIRFTNIEVTMSDNPEPSETEGGPLEGLINISYEYISTQESKQYDPKTNSWKLPSEIIGSEHYIP